MGVVSRRFVFVPWTNVLLILAAFYAQGLTVVSRLNVSFYLTAVVIFPEADLFLYILYRPLTSGRTLDTKT